MQHGLPYTLRSIWFTHIIALCPAYWLHDMHNTIPQQVYHFQVVNNMLSPILIGFVAAFLQSLIIAFKKPSMFYFL